MRRKTLVSASASAGAAALALGALLSGCGGSGRDAYVATGAAGPGSSRSVDGTVPPKGRVELLPLDGGRTTPPPTAPPGPSTRTTGPSIPSTPASPIPARPPTISAGPSDPAPAPGQRPGGTGSGSPPVEPRPGPGSSGGPQLPGTPPTRPADPSPSPGGQSPPAQSADLRVGTPRRTPDAEGRRWCEQVTVTLANAGSRPVTSGTITFGTHIVDLLGLDWATVASTQALPAPIDPGRSVDGVWTVCVDEWRVPPGMRVETRDATASWSDATPSPSQSPSPSPSPSPSSSDTRGQGAGSGGR
ncbi:hypothetical protein [Streptomyces sp. NPDC002537]